MADVYTYELTSLSAAAFQSATANAYFDFQDIEKPAVFLSTRSFTGAGLMTATVDMAMQDPDGSATPDWKHVLQLDNVTKASSVQTQFQASSLTHQTILPYGRLQLTVKASTGGLTIDNIVAKLAASKLI